MKGKYMAYVGSYSYNGQAKGITVYDVDVEEGRFIPRCEVEVDNSSYVIASNDGKTLYSIADEGIVSFRIHENGAITRLNSANIKGMRGCHLSTDAEDRYIFVSGYHDGKSTVLRLNKDGSVGEIVTGVYHKGLGSVAERNFRPHVSCSRRTPDGKFIMVADLGIDQVKIYRFNENDEEMLLVDVLHCDLESAPKCFRFSSDGRFFYLISELKNVIDVFTYETGERQPKIEKIQTVFTAGPKQSQLTAACSMRISNDERHLFCGNAGDNSVTVYERDKETGLLEALCCLPISGSFPKDICVFPDDKHIASINHETGSITFFTVDYKKGLLVMNGKELKVNEPNSCVIVKVDN
ncbi:6-phosphogluconolactonase [Lacrimispora sphenoides]|jgi:6-phosphogluconolactonase|uniref:lactonase family protein n=1 Tax=Lacrimispora sphenoides TaxID=29370 RepID=UPI0008B733C6|nr:beta-propeller fold lactonase family protein [Lacrimispora sphenoides]SET87928.1 6-phosphogluconolactonase [Lacrimispora sphenoides]